VFPFAFVRIEAGSNVVSNLIICKPKAQYVHYALLFIFSYMPISMCKLKATFYDAETLVFVNSDNLLHGQPELLIVMDQ